MSCAPAAGPRADVFIDGQNLFHSVKMLFGHRNPDFDVRKIATELCALRSLTVGRIFFYTGMPSQEESPDWHAYWTRKLSSVGRQDVQIFNPPLRYRDRKEYDATGTQVRVRLPQEKGIDVRIAIDMVGAAWGEKCDAMVLVSQDSDLREAVREAKHIAQSQRRPLKMYSAFPERTDGYSRGVEDTEWICFDQRFYERCVDPRDYWRKPAPAAAAAVTATIDTPARPEPTVVRSGRRVAAPSEADRALQARLAIESGRREQAVPRATLRLRP